MELVVWILFGALVGWVASLIMDTDEQQGSFANIIVGIIGSLLGGYIARMLGGQGITGFNVISFITALGGAMLLLLLFKLFSRRSVL